MARSHEEFVRNKDCSWKQLKQCNICLQRESADTIQEVIKDKESGITNSCPDNKFP